jgi:DNA-binding beta-propeller fold protein YncE
MSTLNTSNWRPLSRAFYAFLVAIAALWAMPRNAGAQLYITQAGGLVSEYNANTGNLIKAKFIKGLYVPVGLAVSDKDNVLFVTSVDTVGKYDATTGAAINTNFITGLTQPSEIAIKSAK